MPNADASRKENGPTRHNAALFSSDLGIILLSAFDARANHQRPGYKETLLLSHGLLDLAMPVFPALYPTASVWGDSVSQHSGRFFVGFCGWPGRRTPILPYMTRQGKRQEQQVTTRDRESLRHAPLAFIWGNMLRAWVG
jgi:hypothetical protein